MIDFNIPKIDSFTLLIPLEKVDVVSSTFMESYKKIYDTGEIEDSEDFYNSYAKTENKNTKTFLKYKKVNRLFNGELRSFIQIMITSKLLCSSYFDGINNSNIRTIFNYILDDGIIEFSYKTFFESYVTDIDICKDYKVSLEEFIALKEMLFNNILATKNSVVSSKRINSKEVFGIQFNERHKSTPSKPFAKLYFKTTELKSSKTLPFTNANLSKYFEDITAGIGRFEVTIKNSKHKEKLELQKVKTLENLIDLTTEELDKAHSSIVKEYYLNDFKVKEASNDLTPTEFKCQGYLDVIYELKPSITAEELIFKCTRYTSDKYKKCKIKKSVLEDIEISRNKTLILDNSIKQKTALDIIKNLGIFED